MRYRISLLAAFVVLAVSVPALLAKDKETGSMHEGKFVSAANDKLTMTGKDGKEMSHMVAKDAKWTVDGKNAKLSEFKSGMMIRVTMAKSTDAKDTVTMVEGLDKNTEFGK